MKIRFITSVCFFLLVIVVNSCVDEIENSQLNARFEMLSGPYFGQEPPGSEPEIFMPGLVTTHDQERCVTFLDGGKVCIYLRDDSGTLFTYLRDGKWTEAQEFPFNYKTDMMDHTPGPDDRTLVFMTSHPIDENDAPDKHHLWTVEWTGSGWGTPVPLPAPDKSAGDGSGYPTISSDGTIYFISGSRNGFEENGIYRCKREDSGYGKAELVEHPINSKYIDFDPYIAPDESYILFNSNRPGGFGYWDTYICFRKDDGSWTPAINLGEGFNSYASEACPNVTADGKYFFFLSTRETDVAKGEKTLSQKNDKDNYWFDTSFIDKLKVKYLNTEPAVDLLRETYLANGLDSAVALLTDMFTDENARFSFLPNELLPLCEEMIIAGNTKDADEFYQALLNTLPDRSRIKLGYAVISSTNGFVDKGLGMVEKLVFEDRTVDLEYALLHIGYQLDYFSKTEDALTVYTLGTKKFPDRYLSFFKLARAYENLGDTERALESCRKARELNPEDTDVADLLNQLEAQ